MLLPATNALSRDVGSRAIQRISVRILPFVFLLYIVSYLDRANVAFAKLTMSRDLGFSEAVFGLGAGLFFLGYLALEIPGAIIVERWSARWWISRILITWGLCTILVGFVRTSTEFYIARSLLGAAEAGFFPGIIVYLAHWFPQEYRARALGKFVLAIPLSLLLGAPISGLLLGVNWLGLAGWRWVFIIEGLPAVLLGFATFVYLVDRPSQAKWLPAEERDWLENELARERNAKTAGARHTAWRGLRDGRAYLLAFGLCFANIGVVGFILWLPTTIQQASGLPAGPSAALSALPFLCGMIGVWICSRSSDRKSERLLHTTLPMLACGVLFGMTALPGQPFPVKLLLLSLSGGAMFAWAPSFWVLPTLTLGESAAAAAIGLINSVGNLGGFVGPFVVGRLLTDNRPFAEAVCFLSACFAVGAVLTFWGGRRSPAVAAMTLELE